MFCMLMVVVIIYIFVGVMVLLGVVVCEIFGMVVVDVVVVICGNCWWKLVSKLFFGFVEFVLGNGVSFKFCVGDVF